MESALDALGSVGYADRVGSCNASMISGRSRLQKYVAAAGANTLQ